MTAAPVADEWCQVCGDRPAAIWPEGHYRAGQTVTLGPQVLCTTCFDRTITPIDKRVHERGEHPERSMALELIDWSRIDESDDAIVEGLALPGRWTALVAPAKAGKSELMLNVALHVSEGHEPFDRHSAAPVVVLHVDAEMGRVDLHERIVAAGFQPCDLTRFHASDMPPRLDTETGGQRLLAAARALGAGLVVIDGINGTVTGAEKDDTTWRAFYLHAIAPLKREGIAVLTADNLGKDETLGPRGSSVKVDKPDAVVQLKRTDNGIKLRTTHRRTSAYPPEWTLSVVGLDGDEHVSYRRTNTAWPDGTEALAAKLDDLGVPRTYGRGKVRGALKAADVKARDTVISAAIRYRKNPREQVREQVGSTQREHPTEQVPPK